MFAKAIDELAGNVITGMIQQQKERNYYVTGKSARSLRYVATKSRITIYGENYWAQQEYGRQPQRGKMPKWFIFAIKEWARAKGLQGIYRTPFPAAYAIHHRGTKTFRKERQSVGISEVIKRELPIFTKRVAHTYTANLVTLL